MYTKFKDTKLLHKKEGISIMRHLHYRFYCTLAESRRQLKHLPNHQLHTVAEDCGYILINHHHALADAEACAEIALQLL